MGNRPAIAVLMFTLAAAATARADEPRPWAVGVSDADQAAAKAHWDEGNALLDQGLYAPALERYRLAIARWDHPSIRYNMAVALISMQKPLEAHDSLERALRFEGAGIEPEVLAQARNYQRILETQVVHLTIECAQPGARVSLDGRELTDCPATRTEVVLAGPHQLIGEKPGYLTRRIDLAVAGGETRSAHIDLMSIDAMTVTRRRWSRWKPWAVAGSGVAVGLVGLGFELQSRATFRSYDAAVEVLCPDVPCAELPAVVTDAYSRGRLQNVVGIGLFAVGGAVIVTGATLVVLNRGVTERLGYDTATAIHPVVAPGHAALAVGGRF